jgi:hypothetical protein
MKKKNIMSNFKILKNNNSNFNNHLKLQKAHIKPKRQHYNKRF